MRGDRGGGVTDFVVSKVALSMCALLVAGCLSSVVEEALSPDLGMDLERVLDDILGTLTVMAAHGGESLVEWRVPVLPSGCCATVSFMSGGVVACADGLTRAAQADIHVWAWNRLPVNGSTLRELDEVSAPLGKSTGDVVAFRGALVPVDDCVELLLFVS